MTAAAVATAKSGHNRRQLSDQKRLQYRQIMRITRIADGSECNAIPNVCDILPRQARVTRFTDTGSLFDDAYCHFSSLLPAESPLLLSMTGFGEAHQQADGLAVMIEVRTINNRYFKFSMRSGEGYTALESQVESRGSRANQTRHGAGESASATAHFAGRFFDQYRGAGKLPPADCKSCRAAGEPMAKCRWQICCCCRAW